MTTPNEIDPDAAMIADMEELIAAMKDPRPSPGRLAAQSVVESSPWPAEDHDPLAVVPRSKAENALDASVALLQARARARATLFGELAPGVRIGRYVLLHELGRGGMGVVYAAYDPELDRKIAIKLLSGRPSRQDPDHAIRLAREARALARLAHPHVVAVHDVGLVSTPAQDDDPGTPSVFVAMEYVEGTTLRGWLAEAPRSQREVLAMLDQAGQGLVAAHDVGLVHRDFKPDNVMVGRDGRARVMDFGLARPLGEGSASPASATTSDDASPEAPATKTGTILGTPAYMAPEQYEGRSDARSDQFAFCVVAWEAFYGRRPFHGRDLMALCAAVIAGRFVDPRPEDRPVPEWLHRVLRRGLAVDPAQRYPSMHALLAALADDPSRRRRRRLAAGGVLALVGLGGVAMAWDQRERERACAAAGAAIDEVWNDEARTDVEGAIEAVSVPYAEDTRVRVVAGLDDYAARWSAVREATCRAHAVDATVDDALAARADACLDERRDAFAAWVELLPITDANTIAILTEVTTELPAVEPCADASWLSRSPAPPEDPQVRERVAALRRRLAGARSLAALAQRDQALADAQAVEAEAEAIGAGWLRASAAMVVAEAADARGDAAGTRAAYERAIASAMAASDDVTAIRALNELAIEDSKAGQLERAQAWLTMARALLPRAEPEPGLQTMLVLNAEGALANMRGDYARAIEAHAQAIAIGEQRLPPGHPRLTNLLNNLGVAQSRHGDVAAASETAERVIEHRERAFGPKHPAVANAYGNLGAIQAGAGRFVEAEAAFDRAIEIAERARPAHHSVGSTLVNRGFNRLNVGRIREGAADLERGRAILEHALGAEHPEVARALVGLGSAYIDNGTPERALTVLARALALREARLGPEHADVAMALDGLGIVQLQLGRIDEAESTVRRALAIRQRTLPADHPDIGTSYGDLGIVLHCRGAFDDAIAMHERAVEIFTVPQIELKAALSTNNLGNALAGAGRLDEAQARYQAVQATAERLGDASVEVFALTGQGLIHELRGQPKQALAAFDRARALGDQAFDPGAAVHAFALVGLAVAAHALGDLAGARTHAERALELRISNAEAPWWRAEAELVLAGILDEDPSTRTRARELRAHACGATRAGIALRLRACDDVPARRR